jgi:filamentous hemagglutinin family protein
MKSIVKAKFQDFGLVLLFAFTCINPASSQVIPDNSLGKDSSIVNPSTSNVDIINGGATKGSNLFHSFQEFSIPTGKGVIFNNAPNIENIINRITGQNISNINGLIQASGKANLFLLNPNGITFGTGARLNIGGSFFASTAPDLRFADGSIFSVNPTQSSPLLTVSTPIGLQLGAKGNINNSGRLVVNSGKSLSLTGANVTHDGLLMAPAGEIQINGASINISPNSQITTTSNTNGGKIFIGSENTQSVYIDKLATIQADALTSGNGGEIKVLSTDSTQAYGSFSAKGGLISGNGGLIETSGNNFLDVAGINVDATAVNGLPGTWLLDPTNITLAYSPTTPDNTIVNIPDIERQLNAGTNVTIRTSDTGTEAGNITANGFAINKTSDNTATLTLQAANDIDLKNFGITSNNGRLGLILEADNDKSGQGNISIASGSIDTNGGIFKLTAADKISLESGAFGSQNRTNHPADDITVKADNISLKAGLNSGTFTAQSSANITVDAKKQLTIEGGGINNISSGDGKSGFVNVNAGNIFIKMGSLRSGANQKGDAGDVNIVVENDFTAEKAGIGSDIGSLSTANPGNVNVKTNTLNLLDNSVLRSNSRFQGTKGGNLSVNANSITTNNSNINTITLGNADGGNINIKTGSLVLRNTQGIIADAGNETTNGTGNAGNINILAKTIDLADRVAISSKTFNEGNAGKINIETGSLLVQQRSGITTESSSTNLNTPGNGGDIEIKADSITLGNRGGIDSRTRNNGNAGNINIKTNTLDITGTSGINVGSESQNLEAIGKAGDINITAEKSIFLRNGAGIGSSTVTAGKAGDINITTNLLSIEGRVNNNFDDGANNLPGDSTNNNTLRPGVTANTGVSFTNGQEISFNNSGDGGTININADSLFINNSSEISGETRGFGQGGKVIINSRSIQLENNSQISTSANRENTNIPEIKNTRNVTAGDIEIKARDIFLNNQSSIDSKGADTQNVNIDGGNIDLTTQRFILLRRQSSISTTANNGGNIIINTPLLVTTPNDNSDITANAFNGRGGKIDINTNSFFGLQIRPQLTGFSDIAAFSQIDPSLNGRIQINSLNTDPTRGSVTFPDKVVDTSTLIASDCSNLNNENQSQFTYTGRGGLPPSPDDLQTSEVIWEDNRIALRQELTKIDNTRVNKQSHQNYRQIQKDDKLPTPATSWIFNNKGEVQLISLNSSPYNLNANHTSCLK